ncbi:hypothetical protein DY000_02040105 [Brassica cretica]|uniref:Uncharacterized protein n=1 Tax=Brassica cretica TaxID=69181 RepID=A0ABQ7BK74_BRACR|nr:hypothetical protein DY000_02040105 [Brassica cretica]
MADKSNQADARDVPLPENRDAAGLRQFSPFRFPKLTKKAGEQMLDPILVMLLMGHNRSTGPRRVEAHSKHSSSKRRL